MIIRKDTHTAATLTGLRRGKDVVKSYLQILCCGMGQLMLPHIEYADRLCLTSKYLVHIVLTQTGRYAADWIRDYVLLEAKAMLGSGQYTVQQVSDYLNFPNQSAFGVYFKRDTGCSPGYRWQ